MDEASPRVIEPFLLIIVGILLVIGVLIWQLSGTILKRPEPTPVATPAFVERVSPSDALQAYNSHTAVFVDVRSSAAYQESHVSGSINISLAEIKDRRNELDKARWIITYCT